MQCGMEVLEAFDVNLKMRDKVNNDEGMRTVIMSLYVMCSGKCYRLRNDCNFASK